VTDHDLTSQALSSSLFSSKTDKNLQPSFLFSAVRQMEEQSSHPLASALRTFCSDALLAYPSPANISIGTTEEITGRGLKGVVVLSVPGGGPDSSTTFEVCIGNEAFVEEIGASTPEGMDSARVEKWKNEAKSIVLVAVKCLSTTAAAGRGGGRGFVVAARFAIADPPRPDAVETIRKLRASGKEVWMLSGDNEATAKAVAIQGAFTSSRPSLLRRDFTKTKTDVTSSVVFSDPHVLLNPSRHRPPLR
jgi:Cu+-exporting ATPase